MIGKENIELLGVPEIKEILLDSDRLIFLGKLGVTKSEIEEVLLEKRILNLAKKLFGKDVVLTLSSTASPLEYDVVGDPKTQNAAKFATEMAATGAVRETLKRVLEIIDKGEPLEEDL